MKIKNRMIDAELRSKGIPLQIIPKILFTRWGFRFLNKFAGKIPIFRRDGTMRFTQQWISRKDGSKLRVCIYKPIEDQKDLPGILWLHGGGFVLGSPEQSASIAKKFAEKRPCVVIAPDYRLSVEAPYPAALEDAYATLVWLKDHANELGIRDDQLMVGGDSAGGGLTAALTLYARDKGKVSISFQMPLYPMLDDRMITESSRFMNTPVWNAKANRICWESYLQKLNCTSDVSCYAAPARATDYTDLPPTATFVGELEPFRDETIQYVENLRSSGVPVDFEMFKGCYHAFEQMCPKAAVSKRALSFLVDSYAYAVEHYVAKQKC